MPGLQRDGGRLAVIGLVMALSASAAYLAMLVGNMTAADTRLYWEYAGRLLARPFTEGFTEWTQFRTGDWRPLDEAALPQRPMAPYTDFTCEYPAGMLWLFMGLRVLAERPESFSLLFGAVMAASVLLMSALSLRLLIGLVPPRATAAAAFLFVAAWPALTGPFAVVRFDSVVTAAAILGACFFLAGRLRLSAVAFGLGGAMKLWPILIVPFILLHLFRSGKGGFVSFGAISLAAFAIPHLALIPLGTHPADLFGYLRYMGDRPLQIESLTANIMVLQALARDVALESSFGFGSNNVLMEGADAWQNAAGAAHVLAAGLVFFLAIRLSGRSTGASRAEGLGAVQLGIALVAVTVLTSRVFSGEYLIWFMPFVVISAASDFGVMIALTYFLSLVLLKLTYRNFDALMNLAADATLLSLVKNAMVLVMAVGFVLAAGTAARGRTLGAARQPAAAS